ncbi:hypothetical protein, partial [Intestinimonas butyriciproducens]|uniref:hypothetical protein n=1 Tax=Intestinimonas butyriciproducens TaxID=1297617 RepID=UPI0019585444
QPGPFRLLLPGRIRDFLKYRKADATKVASAFFLRKKMQQFIVQKCRGKFGTVVKACKKALKIPDIFHKKQEYM